MGMASKPDIVIIPGGFHSPSHFADFCSALESHGFASHCVSLPSVGASDAKAITVTTDIEAVRDGVLLPLLDAGKDAIVLAHSYGGFVAGGAVAGLGRSERKIGGAVVGLVVIAGFPVKELLSLKEATGGRPDAPHAPWIDASEMETTGRLYVNGGGTSAKDVFYHDVQEDKAAKAVAELLDHAEGCFTSPLPYEGVTQESLKGRRLFIYCLQDRAVTKKICKAVVERTEVDWIERDIDSSHSPFLSKPAELAQMIDDFAEGKLAS